MTNVCILTVPGDYHALAVAWAIKKLGSRCDVLYFGDVPQKANISICIEDSSHILLNNDGGSYDLTGYDSFWLRRPDKVILPEDMHKGDRQVSQIEWDDVLKSVIQSLRLFCNFSVNPFHSNLIYSLKPYHLLVAKQSGLNVPKTLVGNNKKDIVNFIDGNLSSNKETIAKSINPFIWQLENGHGATFPTTKVKQDNINLCRADLCPYIYQEYVEKKFEVRVTIFGKSVFASKFQTQNNESSKTDFRMTSDWSSFGYDKVTVPNDVLDCIFKFQKSLNLNFGAFDFIVDENEKWHFLETNTMGNFLWVEEYNRDIFLLDACAKFLISQDNDFNYSFCEKSTISLSMFQDEHKDWAQLLESNMKDHVRRKPPVMID